MSLEDSLYPLLRLYEAAPQPVKTLAGRAYRALPASLRYGKAYARFVNEASASEGWSPDDIGRYQLAELRKTLASANLAPWYRERFAAAGVDPRRFESIDQLADYPLLTKRDLIEHRSSLANPSLPSSLRLPITTGGSSGIPVGFDLHKGISRPKEQAYLEAQWKRRGWMPGERTAVIRGGVTSSRADGRIASFDATRNWLILSSYHLTLDRLPDYVSALNRFRPAHLHAYPSAALMLARGLQQTGLTLDFHFVSVLCGSEKLTPEDQAFLESFFDARILHWYGHSERVVLAAQGRRSSHLYFWPGYGFVEFGDPDANGFREVIGTSFHNRVMPLVRYRTGDLVQLATDPDAELPGIEIEKVIGRDHEFLISRTGRQVSLTAVNMHDEVFDGLLAVQFHQPERGLLTFRFQPGNHWHSSRIDSIRDALNRKLGDDFSLTLEKVAEIEKTSGGKHSWLVSELSQPSPVTASLS
mgnify:CR=1 FL=1